MPLLTAGLGLGVAAAMPIGPVNVEIVRRTLRGGFLAGACVGFGAVTVDVVYAALSITGAAAVANVPAVRIVMGIGGVWLLTWLAWGCFRAAAR